MLPTNHFGFPTWVRLPQGPCASFTRSHLGSATVKHRPHLWETPGLGSSFSQLISNTETQMDSSLNVPLSAFLILTQTLCKCKPRFLKQGPGQSSTLQFLYRQCFFMVHCMTLVQTTVDECLRGAFPTKPLSVLQ